MIGSLLIESTKKLKLKDIDKKYYYLIIGMIFKILYSKSFREYLKFI